MATTAQPVAAGGSESSWEPGTSVGRYTLLTTLATGGMAQIWLARQSGLQGFAKLVVIKRMTNGLEQEPEYVQMFLTEARLAAQLTHPHVVQIYELGEQSGSLYIVMEYLDGEDLASVRRTGQKLGLPVPDQLAAKLVAMAAEGLHYAHTQVGHDGRLLQIVHRDVSPQNLIATFAGGLKVVDFGIAKTAVDTTNSGKLKGKLTYMSPEQARGEPLDPRSDVFSLGIVLFELVTRTRLFPHMNEVDVLATLAGQTALPRPLERRADVPPALAAIVEKAMARELGDRYQSARELQEALEAFIHSLGTPVSVGELSDYLRSLFARRIHERRELIETAMRADLTPASARQLSNLVSQRGRPETQTAATGSLAVFRRRKTWAVALGLALLMGVVGAAVKARSVEAPEEAPKAVAVAPAPVAPPSPTVLMVDTTPAGATLRLDGVDKGQAPLIEEVAAGQHLLEARLDGYQLLTRSVEIERAGERVRIEMALLPNAPVPVPEPAAAPARPRAAPQGKLSLATTPWTEVFLGKKKLGDTPLINLPLPAGTHTLTLKNPESKTRTTIQVEVKANETTVKKLKL